MANFREVGAAGVHLGIDSWDPVTDVVHILGANTESVAAGIVDISLEEHIINLGVQVRTTISGVKTTSDPSNPGVLKVVRSSTPGSVEADEEGHLLTSIEVVDDSSGVIG